MPSLGGQAVDTGAQPKVRCEPGTELTEPFELPCTSEDCPLLLKEGSHLLLVAKKLVLHLGKFLMVITVRSCIAPIGHCPDSALQLHRLLDEYPSPFFDISLKSCPLGSVSFLARGYVIVQTARPSVQLDDQTLCLLFQ